MARCFVPDSDLTSQFVSNPALEPNPNVINFGDVVAHFGDVVAHWQCRGAGPFLTGSGSRYFFSPAPASFHIKIG